MADEFGLDASGVLDGLEGAARAERAELISWLLDDGITVEQIRTAFMPMLLPARRVLGEDGTYVSARQGNDDLPRLRVELATGMAVSRAGD